MKCHNKFIWLLMQYKVEIRFNILINSVLRKIESHRRSSRQYFLLWNNDYDFWCKNIYSVNNLQVKFFKKLYAVWVHSPCSAPIGDNACSRENKKVGELSLYPNISTLTLLGTFMKKRSFLFLGIFLKCKAVALWFVHREEKPKF